MKKILPLLLCLALLLCCTACFRNRVDDSLPQGTASSSESTTTTSASTTLPSSSTSGTGSTTSGTGTTSGSEASSTNSTTNTTTGIPPVVGDNPSTFPWIGKIIEPDGVNVRAEASTDAEAIASGMFGDTVRVLGQEGDWYKVEWEFGSDDVVEAYIYAEFIAYHSQVQ
ncbi:MAG: SH3 domain-containing protein [Clostridia bacterium]|nr:SH3 domain-containing protein [Clostridia bacterium]MBQ2940133.1 SH3 domain-containing protein [Clostridia bacterium]